MTAAKTAPSAPESTLIRAAVVVAILGLLGCFPLLIRETPYTFVLFMFVAQPLLGIAFLLYAVKVFQDLRSGRLF
jgi:hypothetical protein